MKKLLVLAMTAVCATAAGCASPPVSGLPGTMAASGFFLPPKAAHPTAPATDSADAYRNVNPTKRYSLTLKDSDIRDVLALLSKDSTMPIVAEREVEGKVSVSLENRKLGDVLYAVLKPLGYTAVVENGIIVVGRPKLVSRTFSLNYLKDKRTSSSSTSASVSSQGGTVASAAYGGSVISAGSIATGDSGGSGSAGAVKVTTSGSSDFWDEITKALETIIFSSSGGKGTDGGRSEKDGRKLVVNRMAGIVYVTDYSDNMNAISSFLADVENALKRQVLIQAHIVEVGLSNDFNLGLDWKTIIDKSTNFAISQGLVPVPASNVFTVSASGSNFKVLLDAMQEQGRVSMLSSPKISTMNNQRALIKLTTKEVTWVNSTILNATGDTLQTFTTPQVDEVGIFLDVTPNIDENGVITMQVHPSISELTSVSVSPDGKSSKPVIDVREVDTMIDVKSGQTVVIAGLIVDKVRETKRQVPLLGDIPFVGAAFSRIQQEKTKTELVIFLTPYVLNEKNIEDIRREHERRLLSLDEGFQLMNRSWLPEKDAAGLSSVKDGADATPMPVQQIPTSSGAASRTGSEGNRAVGNGGVTGSVAVPDVVAAGGAEAEEYLYTMAVVASRKPGNCRRSVEMFDRFLDAFPDSPLARDLSERRNACLVRTASR